MIKNITVDRYENGWLILVHDHSPAILGDGGEESNGTDKIYIAKEMPDIIHLIANILAEERESKYE